MRIVSKKVWMGARRVTKLRPSTGIYGKRVGGTVPNNAVRQRGRR